MAYVTPIGSNPEQVDYRLGQSHGCVAEGAAEVQFSYHVDGRERPLRWIGNGLEALGIAAGSELTEDQHDTARAIMAGLDPRTGERLVVPKLAVYEDAKVPLAPLVAAVHAAATERGVDPTTLFEAGLIGGAWGRAERAVARQGEGAMLRADDAGRLADAAGLDVGSVWGEDVYADALANLSVLVVSTDEDGNTVQSIEPRRRVVGNMGYDVSFTLPKSASLLLAFADEDTAAEIEALYTRGVVDTFDWLEASTAYGMRGKHGNGKTAQVVAGSGFAGWLMVHRAARPVGDRVVGDPHWHVHATIANMTRGADGKWSTVAAGGRDLMRHAPAADHVLKALARHRMAETFGVQYARSERTGEWEVAAIPDATIREFSKRGVSIAALLSDLGFDAGTTTRRVQDLAASQTRQGKGHGTAAPDATLRELWQAEAREHGVDPDALAAAALPGARDHVSDDARGDVLTARPGPVVDDAAATLRVVVDRLLDPETGLTSTGRRFSRADALAAVADALPGGAPDVETIEAITDAALADAGIVALPTRNPGSPEPGIGVELGAELAVELGGPAAGSAANLNGARRQLGATHMANAARYTTADVIAAEAVILGTAAGSRPGQRAARVDPEVAAMAISAVQAGQGYELSGEQAAAVTRLVTEGRAVDAVLGPPGTGKTTMMRAARTAWQAQGFVVAGAATAAVAAANLHAESGISSRTVAQWVHAIRTESAARDGHGEPGPGGLAGVDVLVLDEANLTEDRDRAVLYTEAARTGTMIVEVGDPLQLRGVGCGSLFGRVHALVEGAALSENRRQREADERAAIAAWREGRYGEALSSWSDRGRLVATETPEEATTAMVATWMREREGAPDPHAEIAGVVMLAATNENVERLNDAAQAVRAKLGELGPGRDYQLAAGRQVRLHEGDYVLIRLNDRAQRRHEGPDVLNGYRGVVEGVTDDGRVAVAWAREGEDGRAVTRAVLDPAFVAAGGLSLGYALTVHKAEGLTVEADWTRPDGTHAGGSVLVHAAGMDAALGHVGTSRSRDQVWIFAAREALETREDTWQRGIPADEAERTARVVGALGAHAAATATNANDVPVHDDLGRDPTRWTRHDEPDHQLEQLLEREHQAEHQAGHQAGREQLGEHDREQTEATAAAGTEPRITTPDDVDGEPVEAVDPRAAEYESAEPAIPARQESQEEPVAAPSPDPAEPRERWAANAALRAAAWQQLDEADRVVEDPDTTDQAAARAAAEHAAAEQAAEARRARDARDELDQAHQVGPERGISL